MQQLEVESWSKEDWYQWRIETLRRAKFWDQYWHEVEATTFEEYLAGDLPKAPKEEGTKTVASITPRG